MTAAVWMRHPDLPQGQLIRVDEVSVPHHRAAGWVVTAAPPAAPKFENEEAPEEGASVSEPAPEKPRRRAPKEAEEK